MRAGPLPLDPYVLRGVEIEGADVLSETEIRDLLVPPRAPRRPLGPAEIDAALARLGDRLVERGFLEAEVALVLRTEPDSTVRIRVREGETARWDTLRVYVAEPAGGLRREDDADTADGTERERPGPRPAPTDVFVAQAFERSLWEWVESWTEAGHPFAVASVESLLVRDGEVRAGVRCDPGPRVTVAGVRFPGRTSTRRSFLESWIRFRADRVFRQSDWEARRRRLAQSGLFLRLGEVVLSPAEDGNILVYMPVEEGPHNRLEGAVGYAGQTETLSGYASVELGNLFGTGRRLEILWERVRAEQSRLGLDYLEPILFGLPLSLRVRLEQEVQDSTYTLDRAELLGEGALGWDLFGELGVEYRRAVLGPAPSERVTRTSTVLGARWDQLDPVRFTGTSLGFRFRTGTSRIDPPGEAPAREQRLDRADFLGQRYERLPGGLVARAQVLASGLSGARDDTLAVSEALWIGGAATLRGYREEAFATRRYGIGQLEVGAVLPGGTGRAYGFADMAWFRELVAPGRVRTRFGWGVGITSVNARRSVSLDFGIPEGASVGDGRIHIRLVTRF